MPIYEYRCTACRHPFEALAAIAACKQPQPCPKCKAPGTREWRTPPTTTRTFIGDRSTVSLTEGFSPAQVRKARADYKGFDIRDNGDVHFTSRAESRRFLKRKKELAE